MPQLDPRVAQTNPALYSAAYYSNLNDAQIKQVNQISNTVGLNRELMNMSPKDAVKRYTRLDPHIQEQLKSMYGQDAVYMPKQAAFVAPTSAGAVVHDLATIGKGAVSTLTGPIRAFFKVAGGYNRVINTPYLVMRQIQQGANPMDVDVWRNAWDGTNVFDNQALAGLHEKYGDTDTFVAMQTLQGRKPGEIIDAYGKVNSEIIGSLTKMLNEPDKFEAMLNDFKGAQISYGRDVARMLFHAQPTDSQLYSSTKWKMISGAIDFAAQIAIDPLTWITGGTSKLATRGERLAELLAKDPTANVAKVFADPLVKRTWDQAGPLIKNLDEARAAKDTARATVVRDEIRRLLPNMNNDEYIDLLAKEKIFDTKAAENFFAKGEDMHKLLGGNVDGTTFYRAGIPIAKRSNRIAAGINKVIGDYFNGSLEKAQLDKVGGNFMDEVYKVGIDNDPLYAAQRPFLEEKTAELRNFKRRMGRMMARFPGSDEIFITDAKVAKSLPVVRNLARTIYPRAYADFFAEYFKGANQEDRVILLKGLYIQIMHNMGMHGTEGGQKLMQQILQDKFADTTGFTVTRDLPVPPQHAEAISSRGLLEEQPAGAAGGLLQSSYGGPIHTFQSKPSIGNLPWHSADGGPSLADYAFNFGKTAQMRAIIDGVGGATRKNFVTKTVDNWSTATLFPRLGIRSSIDEGFFYALTAPGKALIQFAQGRKINKAIIAFAGDDKVIPPIKKAILNALGENPAKWIPEVGEEAKTGRFFKQNVNGEDIYRLQKTETIAEQAVKILKSFNDLDKDKVYQAMLHHPEIANAMVNSIIGKSGIGATIGGGELASMIISNSNLTKAMKELGFIKTGRFTERSVAELEKINESAVAAAHFDNFFMRFTKNGRNYGNGNINFGTLFMRHNGLKSKEDFIKAREEILSGIGIHPSTLTVYDQKALNKYLSESQQYARDRASGWTDIDTAVKRVEMQLLDMYHTFHGNAVAWNDRLYNKIHEIAQVIKEGKPDMPYNTALKEALDAVDFGLFQEYTKGFRPTGMINTDIHFADGEAVEGFLQKMFNWNNDGINHAMEWMDAQNNHIFRQPALWSMYINYRNRYAKLEENFAQAQIRNGMTKEMAYTLAEKTYTEVAMNHAANSILKYVDNPKVRSNLSWTLRTAGRYYRATEDFYRRVFRLKDLTPQVLYRLRLAHIGFQSNGFLHPDENGDPYLVMPADNIIFHAVNGSIAALTGNREAIKQPMFNEFAVKLAMGNPSFQQDAGQPSLSGPFIALPVLGLKTMMGLFGGDFGKKVASNVDKIILGNVNENLDLAKAIVPSSLQRVWNMLPKGEQDQQTVSAAMQAIAYNAANGLFLSPEKLAAMDPADAPKAIADYKKQVMVSTHNILFMRNFLGLLAPISPTMQESKSVPDYLKNLGINGLRPEFADILQSVMRNSRGDIQDPYGAALMAFTGKFPGKLVYTVARDQKGVNVILNKTKALKDWMLNNDSKLKQYPSGAGLIFAPNVGDYDSGTYAWMQAAGLLERRSLDDYFNEVAIVQDRQKYYDLRTRMEEQLMDPTLDGTQRRYIIDRTKAEQDLLKRNNPYLETALNSKTFGIGKQEQMFNELQGIVKDPNFPMSDGQRKKMGIAIKLVRDGLDAIKADAFESVVNGPAAKQEMKQRILAALRELGGAEGQNAPQDPYIREAMRSVFTPLLDFYIRNTQKVTG